MHCRKAKGKKFCFAFPFILMWPLERYAFVLFNIVQAQHIEIYLGWWKNTLSKKNKKNSMWQKHTDPVRKHLLQNCFYSQIHRGKGAHSVILIQILSFLSLKCCHTVPSGTLQADRNYAPAFPVLAWLGRTPNALERKNKQTKKTLFFSLSCKWNRDNMETNKGYTKKISGKCRNKHSYSRLSKKLWIFLSAHNNKIIFRKV